MALRQGAVESRTYFGEEEAGGPWLGSAGFRRGSRLPEAGRWNGDEPEGVTRRLIAKCAMNGTLAKGNGSDDRAPRRDEMRCNLTYLINLVRIVPGGRGVCAGVRRQDAPNISSTQGREASQHLC